MTKRAQPFLFLLAAGLSATIIACGGDSSPVSAPDAPTVAPMPPAGGATIAGTVVGGTAASGDVGASSAAGLKVSVTGTTLQATTDPAGRFTLSGVPSGQAELRFQGPGVDARLPVEGLQNGQTMALTVRVSGNSASCVDDGDENEVELKGAIESVGPGSLVVAGRTVRVDGSTRILGKDKLPVPLSSLGVGDVVEVEGTAQADGSVFARKIKVEDDDEDCGDGNGSYVEFRGTVSSLSPLTIAGRTVKTDSGTRYYGLRHQPATAADVLKVGNKVEVHGVEQADKSVLAKKIKLED
jgi:hypothetical protein